MNRLSHNKRRGKKLEKKIILYQTISETIKRDILTGKYPLNSFIPTENELEILFKASKITVRKAIELLVSEGYLEKQRAIGTKVISNRLFNKLSKANSFSTILMDKGLNLRKEILTVNTVPKERLNELKAYFNGEVTEIKRLYYLDDKPFIYYTHYLTSGKQTIKNIELKQLSLYQLMKENGLTVARFEDQFHVRKISAKIMKMLQTSQTHLLERRRVSYNSDQQVIEYSVGICQTELHPYQIDYEI